MQPLFIGPYDVGVQRNLTPFMLPEQAFPSLSDAYVFRGRIKRKTGHKLIGRLRRVQTVQAAGNISAGGAGLFTFNLFTGMGLLATEPNAQIQSGDITNISIVIGAPINQTLTDTVGTGTLTIVGAGPIVSATLNYATGVLSLIFSGAAAASAATFTGAYFPTLPVMGLCSRELVSINAEQTVAFDTKYAYRFTGGQWSDLPSTLITTWSATNSDFFWTTNYWKDPTNNGLFWETNNKIGLHGFAVTLFGGAAAGPPSTVNVTAAGNTFQVGDTVYFLNLSGAGAANNLLSGTVTIAGNPFTISNPGTGVFANGAVTGLVLSPNRNTNGDGIRYYNGTTWANFNAAVNGTTAVMGCLILLPYKDRLVLLNTYEGNDLTPSATQFRQRARWSQNGSPIDPLTSAWRDDIVGRGGFVDAPTNEQIISAEFLKDQLIVYFERSTWTLVYTGNEILPFVWQKINTELGAESTFSSVPFDNGVVAMGNVGLHTTNGISVQRIDSDIPDEVFNINNDNNGVKRVYGIRDYFKELVYFTYPESSNNPTYPNKVLVYNYKNDTWSFFNESFTCYGYFQRSSDLTWADLIATGPYPNWTQWNDAWNSGALQSNFLDICAGNQQGFVMQLIPDTLANSHTRTITDVTGTTIISPNHNLFVGNYIYIDNCLGTTNLNGQIFQVQGVTANQFTILIAGVGIYLGNGTFKVLSNTKIQTKMFNPFWSSGQRFRLKSIEYLFDKTDGGEVTANIFIDTSSSGSLSDPNGLIVSPGCILGNNTIFTKPETLLAVQQQDQSVIWHRGYYYIEGETFQVTIELSPTQMTDILVNESDVVLHGMILSFESAGTFQ